MIEAITALRLHLLQVVAKYPDIRRDKLLTVKGAQGADIDYLVQHDLQGKDAEAALGIIVLATWREDGP